MTIQVLFELAYDLITLLELLLHFCVSPLVLTHVITSLSYYFICSCELLFLGSSRRLTSWCILLHWRRRALWWWLVTTPTWLWLVLALSWIGILVYLSWSVHVIKIIILHILLHSLRHITILSRIIHWRRHASTLIQILLHSLWHIAILACILGIWLWWHLISWLWLWSPLSTWWRIIHVIATVVLVRWWSVRRLLRFLVLATSGHSTEVLRGITTTLVEVTIEITSWRSLS